MEVKYESPKRRTCLSRYDLKSDGWLEKYHVAAGAQVLTEDFQLHELPHDGRLIARSRGVRIFVEWWAGFWRSARSEDEDARRPHASGDGLMGYRS
jgi:hypothetical protein